MDAHAPVRGQESDRSAARSPIRWPVGARRAAAPQSVARPVACRSLLGVRGRIDAGLASPVARAWLPSPRGVPRLVSAHPDQLCLDWVSRPEAFAQLWPKLRLGYLLDALERLDQPATHTARIAGFIDEATDAPTTRQPSAGLGHDLRLRGPGVIGSGLELDEELLQLSAFTSDGGADRAFGRIARPSRRR